MILHIKKIYCKDIENELKSYHNKTDWANFVVMQDSWLQLKSDSISWRKTLKNSHSSRIQWPVVSTPCQETKIHLNQKVGSEGTPRLDPHWKLQPVACKVNMEWKSELCLWTKTILTHGPEFLMAWISWSQTWTKGPRRQRAGNHAVRRLSVEIECKWFCKPIKGQSKTTKTQFCQLIHKNYTYWRKNLDWYWTTKIFALRLSSVEETNQSSSSW